MFYYYNIYSIIYIYTIYHELKAPLIPSLGCWWRRRKKTKKKPPPFFPGEGFPAAGEADDGQEEEVGRHQAGRGRSDHIRDLLQRRQFPLPALLPGHEPAEARLPIRRAPLPGEDPLESPSRFAKSAIFFGVADCSGIGDVLVVGWVRLFAVRI